MHVGVIQHLRCPAAHVESALVLSAARQADRRVIQGELGCPVCAAEYPITSGITDFRSSRTPSWSALQREARDEATLRLAAQLNLTEPGKLVLLAGPYSAFAPPLNVTYDALCLTVGAAESTEVHLAAHASVLRVDRVLPLAVGALHGVAVDTAHARVFGLEQLRKLLRANGRLVAPAQAAVPSGMDLLARDEFEWVAARAPESDVVPLRRGAR